MHYIQSKILDQLLYADALRYSQLKPKDIESNHFAYHLKELQKSRMIVRKGDGYALGPKGLAYVDRLSHEYMTRREQAHIVTITKLINDKGQAALYKRNFQPYWHRVGFVMGKTHLGETIVEAAEREVMEKTGLTVGGLTQKGIYYLETSQDDTVISSVLAHAFVGQVKGAPELLKNDRGEAFWGELEGHAADQLMPALERVNKLIENSKGFFFDELSVQLES